jgi:hypothetical protein
VLPADIINKRLVIKISKYKEREGIIINNLYWRENEIFPNIIISFPTRKVFDKLRKEFEIERR